MVMKKLIALVVLLGLTVPGRGSVHNSASFTIRYDLDSTTTTYVRMVGKNGSPWGGSIEGIGGRIATSGSATTVTGTATFPAAQFNAGDVLAVTRPTGTTDLRAISVWTDANTVTVDEAVDWTGGFAYRWYNFETGTTAADGWVDVSNYSWVQFSWQYDQGDSTVDVRFECKSDHVGAEAIVVYPGESDGCGAGTLASGFCQFASAGVGITNRIAVKDDTSGWAFCRIGQKINGADASDATTNMERITAGITGGE